MSALRTAATLARRTALCAGLALAPAAAFAQPSYTTTYNSPATGAAAFGYTVGPQNATLFTAPGQALGVTLFCVDYQNAVTDGLTYQAHLTSLGAAVSGAGALTLTRHPAGLTGYRKAAFLIDQFATNAQDNWGGIQGAIWQLFGAPGAPSTGSAGTADMTTTAYWADVANTFAGNTAAFDGYDYSRFTIVTDVRAAGSADDAFAQEFMTPSTVTPEPGSVVLMAVGLLATAGASARRRRAAVAA